MSALDEWFMTPSPPHWTVDWPALDARFEWIRRMRETPQDPVWHAEGDVWVHTRMVCEQLAVAPAWRGLGERDRRVCWLGALFHDVAKPYSTQLDGTRIRSRHHAPRGATHARRVLWRAGAPVAEREEVCGLVRHHQLPVHALDGADCERRVSAASMRCGLARLAIVAQADIRGRECADTQAQLDAIALFVEYAGELGCLEGPRTFASDHTRWLYFRGERPAVVEAYDDTTCRVTLLSGLPGAGKTHWTRHHRADQPVVSLDQIRIELSIDPRGNQGPVLQRARALARQYLRSQTDFVWDATNLVGRRRSRLTDLFRDYGAYVEIVSIETGPEQLSRQNAARDRPVAQRVIDGMLRQWEVPDRTEGHRVWWEASANRRP